MVEVSSEIAPLAPPPVTGEKVTLNVALCPAVRVIGNAGPVRLNPTPVIAPWETVRLDLPELVSIKGCVDNAPTWTLPKFILDELTVSCALAGAAQRRRVRARNPLICDNE